jgi:drug/metabolite transporter (DMT)-like permease
MGGAQLAPDVWRKGMIAGLLAVAGFGFGNVVRGLAMREWSEALLGTVIATLGAVVLQLAVTRDWKKIAAQFRAADRAAIALYAGCGIATSIGSIFISLAMTRMEIGLAVLVVHTTPLVIFPVSVFVLGSREELVPRTLVGALLVLSGIALLAMR